MNLAFSQIALLTLLSPIAVGQTVERASDCSTLKYLKHKVSCLCGTVEICAGDICGDPADYELDDDITVELRTKGGAVIDTQKAVTEVSQQQGAGLGGTAFTFEQKARRFSFKDKRDGDYLLAFILHKGGTAQPAVIFPTNYSHKRNRPGTSFYMVESDCPK